MVREQAYTRTAEEGHSWPYPTRLIFGNRIFVPPIRDAQDVWEHITKQAVPESDGPD